MVAICGHTIHRRFAHKRSRPFTLSELNLDDNLEEDLVGSWQNLAGRGNWRLEHLRKACCPDMFLLAHGRPDIC